MSLDIALFKKISIIGKFFIPPVAAVLLILAMGGFLGSAYIQIKTEVDDAEEISSLYSEVQETMLILSNAHANMTRTVSWTQAGVVKRILGISESDTRETLAKVKTGLGSIKANQNAYTSDKIDGIIAKFDEYAGDVDIILNNLKVDAFLASMQMTTADIEYKDIVADAGKVVEALTAAQVEGNEHVNKAMSDAKLLFIVSTGIAIVFLSILATIVGKAVSDPTNALTRVMAEMSKGNKKLEIPGTDRGDELGSMAQAVKIFRDSLILAEENDARAAKERAEKELKAKALVAASDKFSSEIGDLLGAVGNALNQVQEVSESMDRTVGSATSQTMAVSAATEQANGNVTAVASAAEEMDRSIQEISAQVTKQSSVTGTANKNMEAANNQVRNLNDSVEKVSEIVTLISSIADQTNLLALNATIEAARAGDAGKGFAVVATEVKGLATQTTKATDDIGAKIEDIKTQTAATVEAINLVTDSLSQLNELSTVVASAVEEQSAATGEISSNISQAAIGTAEVSRNIQGVSGAMSDISNFSKRVLQARQDLASQSDNLRNRIQGFLQEVSE